MINQGESCIVIYLSFSIWYVVSKIGGASYVLSFAAWVTATCILGCVQVLSSKMLEKETRYRQLSQEQLDNFTLDMNTAYARLKGMEEAIDSKTDRQTDTHTPFEKRLKYPCTYQYRHTVLWRSICTFMDYLFFEDIYQISDHQTTFKFVK